jgi:hypothetical protein
LALAVRWRVMIRCEIALFGRAHEATGKVHDPTV